MTDGFRDGVDGTGATESLFVVIVAAADPQRQRAADRLLTAWGDRVRGGVWELLLTPRSAGRLEAQLAAVLAPEDTARIYAVCTRCVARARIHGELELPVKPVVWVF